MKKALALISTGLDSLLAAAVVQHQGIEVEGVCFVMAFDNLARKAHSGGVEESVASLGIPVRVVDISGEFLPTLLHPAHGYGSGVNPCIDCHLFMLRKAHDMLAETGADFLVTGEVVGQRPMSQRRDTLAHMNKIMPFSDLVLRPLSARLLPPTLPEREGWVDREALYAISGRSRKQQMEMAKAFGFTSYSSPAGGCILTDPVFSRRLKRLFDIKGRDAVTLQDLQLLRIGRHFCLEDSTHIVVGRNEAENERLSDFFPHGWRFEPRDVPGPLVISDDVSGPAQVALAAAVTARYTSKSATGAPVAVVWRHGEEGGVVEAAPAAEKSLEKWRL
ncbi:hypothetical protein JXO52_07825 [bacterium]|nr:hypothetical protein [bacterium]